MQAGNLVAAEHVDFAVHNLQPERLEQTGCKTLPLQLAERLVNAADEPHIAADAANRGLRRVGEEVEAAGANPGVPRVRLAVRESQRVHGVGTVALAEHADGFDDGVPLGRAALGERGEIRCAGLRRGPAGGERDDEGGRLLSSGEIQDEQAGSGGLDGCAREVVAGLELRVRGEQKLLRRGSAFEVDGARERLARGVVAGQFEHAHLADGVAEDDLLAVDVEATPLGPLLRQRSVGDEFAPVLHWRLRLDEATTRVRPTGQHLGLEGDFPDRRSDAFQALAARGQLHEPATPAETEAQSLGVEAHRRVVAEIDVEALERGAEDVALLADDLQSAAVERAEVHRVPLRAGGFGLGCRLIFLRVLLRVGGTDREEGEDESGSENERLEQCLLHSQLGGKRGGE